MPKRYEFGTVVSIFFSLFSTFMPVPNSQSFFMRCILFSALRDIFASPSPREPFSPHSHSSPPLGLLHSKQIFITDNFVIVARAIGVILANIWSRSVRWCLWHHKLHSLLTSYNARLRRELNFFFFLSVHWNPLLNMSQRSRLFIAG